MCVFELFIGLIFYYVQLEKMLNMLLLIKNVVFVQVWKFDIVVYYNDGELIDFGIVIMLLSLLI